MLRRFPRIFGCIICLQNDRIIAGQRWPIIPGGGGANGGAAALPLVLRYSWIHFPLR